MLRVATLLLLLLAPVAAAQGEERIDVRIGLDAEGATVEGAGVALAGADPGDAYRFTLNLTSAYTTFEVRASGLAIERPRQLVPLLHVAGGEASCRTPGACEYPLFEAFPDDRIWDVDAPARVFFTSGTKDAVVLRLGVPGPVNATLVLQRDVTPPAFTLRPWSNVTTFGFYQETTTDELALANMEVRENGTAKEWVPNPTPTYHLLQRFPIQGLSPNRTYDVRVTFRDWAENAATSPTYQVTSLAEPAKPIPVVAAASPAPDARVGPGEVEVRATWTSPESPVPRSGVRVFFDKTEVTAAAAVGAEEATYRPPSPLARGVHAVSVEVTNEAGGRGVARWTFHVGAAVDATGALALLAVAAGAAVVLRRR